MAVTVASPKAFVVAGDPRRTADAPEAGGVKVTVALGTGLPFESETRATSGSVKAVPTAVVWPLPLLTVMFEGAPAVFVSEKLAGTTMPVTEATTL